MKKTAVAIVLIVAALLSANSRPASAAWGSITTITGFYVWSEGNAHFRVANMENPSGCANPAYLTLDVTKARFKELYANLMLAYTAGKTVQLSYGACNASGFPVIDSIAVPSVW